MNIEAFLLCDAATEQQGKLNVLGAFDIIWANQLPAKHPACSIVTRICFEKSKDEDGDHSMKIQIIDKDGNNIGPKLEGNISVKTQADLDSSVVNLVLNIQNLEFKEYGGYQVDLKIDDKPQASLPFRVSKPPNQAQSTK